MESRTRGPSAVVMMVFPPIRLMSWILTPFVRSRVGSGGHRERVPSAVPVRSPAEPREMLVTTLRRGRRSVISPVLLAITTSPWEPPSATWSPRCLTACTPDFMRNSWLVRSAVPETSSSRAFEALLPARISLPSSETSRDIT